MNAASFSGEELRRLRGAVAYSRHRMFSSLLARSLRRDGGSGALSAVSAENRKREKVLVAILLVTAFSYLAMNGLLPFGGEDQQAERARGKEIIQRISGVP